MRILKPAALSCLLLIGSAFDRPQRPPFLRLCSISRMAIDDPVSPLLGSHGIQTIGFDSEILVDGSLDDLFRARDCLTTHEHACGLDVGWPADFVTLPVDPNWPEFRVASIDHSWISSRAIIALLEGEGIHVQVYFGRTTDFLFVPRRDAERAIATLEARSRPGLTVHSARRG